MSLTVITTKFGAVAAVAEGSIAKEMTGVSAINTPTVHTEARAFVALPKTPGSHNGRDSHCPIACGCRKGAICISCAALITSTCPALKQV